MGQSDRKRIVVFSRCIPFEGIDHAGGEYVLREIRALQGTFDFTVIAPATPTNERAMDRVEGFEAILVRPRGMFATLPARATRRLQERVGLPRVPFGFRHAAGSIPAVREALGRADLVEFQWTEMAGFRSVARRYSDAPSIVVVHDVLSQRAQRSWEAKPSLRRFAAVRSRAAGRYERRLLKSSSAVVTFSDKDRELLTSLVPTADDITVIHPPLDEERMRSPREPEPFRVLLVGNFGRLENRDAAVWFGTEIWPAIRRSVPEAIWVIAGSGGELVLSEVGGVEGVEVTGYVEDLGSEYQRASVCVVPVRLGAGVKFKTLTAMLWGIPVIATPEGAEGLCGPDGFAAVTSDPSQFASAVVRGLHNDESTVRAARFANEWASSRAGTDVFISSVTELFETVWADGRN